MKPYLEPFGSEGVRAAERPRRLGVMSTSPLASSGRRDEQTCRAIVGYIDIYVGILKGVYIGCTNGLQRIMKDFGILP